jgi:hypothetical protein
MKKTLLTLVAAVMIAMPVHAATTQTVNVSTSISSVLDLSMTVFKLNAAGTPIGSDLGGTMAFGELVRDTTYSVMRGADAYTVYLNANTSSRAYTITATMPALTNGTVNLPPALGMTTVSAQSGNADITGDSVTGITTVNAIMTNQTIYTSNTSGTGAFIQLVYGISGGQAVGTPFTGWQAILLDQASGTYQASVTYTLALS